MVSLAPALGVTALAGSVAYLLFALLTGPRVASRRAVANLQRGLSEPTQSVAGSPSARFMQRGASIARTLTPRADVVWLERLLARAGRPPAWPLDRILTAKLVLTLGAAGLSLLYISAKPTSTSIEIGLAVTLLAFFLPELRLYSLGIERRETMTLELPDTIDQMSIAVEAGLGFDAAMGRVARNSQGVLAQELVRTMQDIQVGQSRRAAYEDLADRTNVDDLRRFLRSITGAEAYGLALSQVLHTQAAEMRLKRQQRAEEQAMKIPVKVTFPLVFCILPVIFIVILGPAVINIIAAFHK